MLGYINVEVLLAIGLILVVGAMQLASSLCRRVAEDVGSMGP